MRGRWKKKWQRAFAFKPIEVRAQQIESLQQQNAALAQENANMYAVIDQNRALTAMLEELRPAQPEAEAEVAGEPP